MVKGMELTRMTSLIGRKNIKGFSITEIIIVMALMSMLIGMSLPLFGRFSSASQLKTSTKDVSSMFRQARQKAITHRGKYTVKINIDSFPQSVWIEDANGALADKKYELPATVSFDNTEDPFDVCSFEGNQVTFKPVGSVEGSGGYIWLSHKNGKRMQISVFKMSGRVKIEAR